MSFYRCLGGYTVSGNKLPFFYHEEHKALRLCIFVPFVVDKIAADQKRHFHAVHGIVDLFHNLVNPGDFS